MGGSERKFHFSVYFMIFIQGEWMVYMITWSFMITLSWSMSDNTWSFMIILSSYYEIMMLFTMVPYARNLPPLLINYQGSIQYFLLINLTNYSYTWIIECNSVFSYIFVFWHLYTALERLFLQHQVTLCLIMVTSPLHMTAWYCIQKPIQ